MDLGETGWGGGMDWIHLAQDRARDLFFMHQTIRHSSFLLESYYAMLLHLQYIIFCYHISPACVLDGKQFSTSQTQDIFWSSQVKLYNIVIHLKL
jgi:hypothetical protein